MAYLLEEKINGIKTYKEFDPKQYNQSLEKYFKEGSEFSKNENNEIKIFDVGERELSTKSEDFLEKLVENIEKDKRVYLLASEDVINYNKTVNYFNHLDKVLETLQEKNIIGEHSKLSIISKKNEDPICKYDEFLEGCNIKEIEQKNHSWFLVFDLSDYLKEKIDKIDDVKLRDELKLPFEKLSKDNSLYNFNMHENFAFFYEKEKDKTKVMFLGAIDDKKYAMMDICKNEDSEKRNEIFKEFAMANSKVGYFKSLKEFEVGKEHLLLKTEDIREKAKLQANYLKNAFEDETLEEVKNDIISNSLKPKNFLGKDELLLANSDNEISLEIEEPILETAVEYFNSRFFNLKGSEKERFISDNIDEILELGVAIVENRDKVFNDIADKIVFEISEKLENLRKNNYERITDENEKADREWNINLDDFYNLGKEYKNKESGIIFKEEFFLTNVYALNIIDNQLDYKFEDPNYILEKFNDKLENEFDYNRKDRIAIFKNNMLKLEEENLSDVNEKYNFVAENYEDLFLKEYNEKYEKENEKTEDLIKAIKDYFEK